jgi:hypothetical protein
VTSQELTLSTGASPVSDVPEGAPRGVPATPEILMIGGAAYTTRFVLDLARQVQSTGRFRLSSLGLGDQSAARSEIPSDLFARQFAFPTLPPRPRTLRQNARLLRLLVHAAYCHVARFAPESANGASIRRPLKRRIARRLDALRLHTETLPLIAGFDVYHYHSLEPARLCLLSVLPVGAKTVLSIWGSDLMRIAGTSDYVDQLAACNRADVITVSSLEIREILLSKFGRHLAPKVRLALLGATLLDEVDRCRGQRAAFLEGFGLPEDSITVCIGNSASRGNQHIEVVRQLARLGPSHTRRVCLLFPLSHRPHATYVAELRALAATVPFRSIFLDRKMTNREVAGLRCGTDVLIHVPISDAFSAAMLESIYAGSLVITGAWLPYSRLRASRIHFHELHQLDELPGLLARVIDSIDAERRNSMPNPARIRELVHPTRTVDAWVAIYDELVADTASRAAS